MTKRKNIIVSCFILAAISMILGFFLWLNNYLNKFLEDTSTTIEGTINVKLGGELIDMSLIEIECIDGSDNKYVVTREFNVEGELKYCVEKEEKNIYQFYFYIPKSTYDKRNLKEKVIYELSTVQMEGDNAVCTVNIDINKSEGTKWGSVFEAGIAVNGGTNFVEEINESDLTRNDKLALYFGP